MKSFLKMGLFLSILMLFTACQENKNSKPYLINGQNPNSLAYKNQEKDLDRKNKVEIAQIAAKSKLEVAEVESKKAIEIATIESYAKKDIAKDTALASVEISKMDTQTKDKQSMITLYIAIGVIFTLLVMIFLWYRNKKKSLEMQIKLQQSRLEHEFAMKEKELQEQRIQKILDFAISGQLAPEVQKEIISSITNQDKKLLESK